VEALLPAIKFLLYAIGAYFILAASFVLIFVAVAVTVALMARR
jgi:hypothetical protein